VQFTATTFWLTFFAGHTLRLLQLPTALQKGLDKIMGYRDVVGGGMLGQVLSMVSGGSEASQPLNQMMEKLGQLREIVDKVALMAKGKDIELA